MKAGLIIFDEEVREAGLAKTLKNLEFNIERLIEAGINKFYIIIPETGRYEIVKLILNKFRDDTEFVFREIYGEYGGGGIISLIPFIGYGEKIIVIESAYRYRNYLYKYFIDILYNTDYPVVFLGDDAGPPYARLQGDRITYFLDTVYDKLRYGYVGASILTHRFLHLMGENHLIYPDLHTRDTTELFNLYLSKGGILKAEILMRDEWSRI